MLNDQQKELLEYYGEECQLMKAAEELNELGQVIIKTVLSLKNYDKNNTVIYREDVKKEIADVEVTVDYVKSFFDIREFELDKVKKDKLDIAVERKRAREEAEYKIK